MSASLKASWQQVKLKDVCQEITVGYVGPMIDEYVEDGITFLRSQNVLPFHIDLSSVKFVSTIFHKKLKKSALRPGDIVVVRTGYPGTACVIPPTLPIANCADLVIIRTLPHVDPYYLTNLFNSAWGRGTIAGRLVGVAQQHFNVSAAKEMVVNLPPLPIQQKIASILSAYDDLIENNTRRIAILEQMARMLYEEWFVKFRFPGHEQVKMVETEMGMIPEGWHVENFGQLADLARRTINPDKFKDETVVHYSLPAFDAGQMPIVELGKNIKSSKFLVPNGAILLSKLNPHIPRIWLPIDTASPFVVASTEFLVLLPKNSFSREFIFCCCCSQNFMDRFISKAIGTSTSHQRVKPENLINTEIIHPDPEIVRKFTVIAEPLFKNLHNLRLRNANLRRTRDLLLPKLISGEIDVSSWVEGEIEPEEPLAIATKDPAVVRERAPTIPIDVGSLEQHSLWD